MQDRSHLDAYTTISYIIIILIKSEIRGSRTPPAILTCLGQKQIEEKIKRKITTHAELI